MGLFHVGVEAYNLEWSFSYTLDASANDNDNTTNKKPNEPEGGSTGVIQSAPKRLYADLHRETIEVGWTSLTESEVKAVIRRLCFRWRAHTYHLTRRNCVNFSEDLIEKLGLADRFPAKLKNACEAIVGSGALSSVTDGTWAAARWWLEGKKISLPNPGSCGSSLMLEKCSEEAADSQVTSKAMARISPAHEVLVKSQSLLYSSAEANGSLRGMGMTCGGSPDDSKKRAGLTRKQGFEQTTVDGWERTYDLASGRVYYFNLESGTTTWEVVSDDNECIVNKHPLHGNKVWRLG